MDIDLSSRSMPLVSFHTLVDEDVGVFKLILSNYGESSAINKDLISKMSALEVIGKIYKRKYDNPLNLIKSSEKYSDLLDRCYKELITEYEADVIEHSVITEFFNLVLKFNDIGEIIPTILCYTQEQCDAISEIKELQGIEVVGPKEALENIDKYTQFYFKYLFEYDIFKDDLRKCTVYFSSVGLNFDEDDLDILIDNEEIKNMIQKDIKVAFFDLYRMNILGDQK